MNMIFFEQSEKILSAKKSFHKVRIGNIKINLFYTGAILVRTIINEKNRCKIITMTEKEGGNILLYAQCTPHYNIIFNCTDREQCKPSYMFHGIIVRKKENTEDTFCGYLKCKPTNNREFLSSIRVTKYYSVDGSELITKYNVLYDYPVSCIKMCNDFALNYGLWKSSERYECVVPFKIDESVIYPTTNTKKYIREYVNDIPTYIDTIKTVTAEELEETIKTWNNIADLIGG